MFKLVILYMLCSLSGFVQSQADGWKMTDRFYGFRYELKGSFPNTTENSIVEQADSLGCFGWVQRTKTNHLVGEVRCAKLRGPNFQSWLEELPNVVEKEFLVYSDTKIRLHFSTFSTLPSERHTCFLDKPHQCPEFHNEPAKSRPATDEL